MIFNVPGHIEMIRNGLVYPIKPSDILYHPMPQRIIKTQTRRLNRGIYQVGKDYAVQLKRGVKGEPDIRIVMDKIRIEVCNMYGLAIGGGVPLKLISLGNALAEGGYLPVEFEKLFRAIAPKWDGKYRWAFTFHAVEVQR